MLLVPSVYLGNIFYWSSLLKEPVVYMDEGEFFVKQTYRNRAEIASESGVTPLTVPLEKGKNNKQPMHQVCISYNENWQALHFKTICSAYGKAAYFDHYKPELEHLFTERPTHLCTWNAMWFRFFADEFELTFPGLVRSQTYLEARPSDTDLRPLMTSKGTEEHRHPSYYHVFFQKYPQPQNLSVLDLLMNEGPRGRFVLE